MSDIDWNAEIRKIEREYDGLPPEQPAGILRTKKAAEWQERQRLEMGKAVLGAWARMALVAVLAVSLYWWPNAHQCGLDLSGFLAAAAMVVVAGLWIAAFTWRHRIAASHGGAIALVIAGLVLIAAQTLPRLGYAKIAGVRGEHWSCGAK